VERVTADRIRDYLQAWPMDRNGYLASLGPRQWP
jgi:hypothetical protein